MKEKGKDKLAMRDQKKALVKILGLIVCAFFLTAVLIRFGPGIAKTAKAVKNNETINMWEAFDMDDWFSGGWDIFGIFHDGSKETEKELSSEEKESEKETEKETTSQYVQYTPSGNDVEEKRENNGSS